MTVLMVQFSVEPANVGEIESAAETMCAALKDANLSGVRFAACKLADGVSFLNVVQLENQTPNPLPGLQAAREFQQLMAARALGHQPPVAAQVTVLGSHHLF
ncbi:hypothetical protein [Pseudonocardia parietis]|uniref:Antibiotic biosynthesis monooxygenase n=1 Tax=Pseudonocardia parietis TaxID=570936 RepID=A0ABS4W6T9_9PSEU|nr:hypothetical protein [Pseudonocardia parietis]MBP2371923.1 hypothetical protein [Pseudonocardia parietis]